MRSSTTSRLWHRIVGRPSCAISGPANSANVSDSSTTGVPGAQVVEERHRPRQRRQLADRRLDRAEPEPVAVEQVEPAAHQHVVVGLVAGRAAQLRRCRCARRRRSRSPARARPRRRAPPSSGGRPPSRHVARRAFSAISPTMSGQRGSGRSWPMSGYMTSLAPGTARAVAMPPLGRTSGSARPWTTSVGTRTRPRSHVRSLLAAMATVWRAAPSGPPAAVERLLDPSCRAASASKCGPAVRRKTSTPLLDGVVRRCGRPAVAACAAATA